MADLVIIAYETEEKAEAARKKLLELQKEYLIAVSYTHLTLPTKA